MKTSVIIALVAMLSVNAHKLDAKPKVDPPTDVEKNLEKFGFRLEEAKEKLEDCIKETKPKEGVDPENVCRPEKGKVDALHKTTFAAASAWLERAEKLGFNKDGAKPPRDLKDFKEQIKELPLVKKSLDDQVALETLAYKKPLEDDKKVVEAITKKIAEAAEIDAEHKKHATIDIGAEV